MTRQRPDAVYDESKIKTLSSLEHIRLRTGMYIGRIGDGSSPDDGVYILLKEVIDNYQPDLIWFDSWVNEIPDDVKMQFLAHYFNRAKEWDKDVVVTFKQQDLPRSVAVDQKSP